MNKIVLHALHIFAFFTWSTENVVVDANLGFLSLMVKFSSRLQKEVTFISK